MLWCVTNGRAEAPPKSGCEDRRLDLQEAARVEELAHRRQYLAARDEDGQFGLAVGDQIQVAPAIARLVVDQLERRPPRPWPAAASATWPAAGSARRCSVFSPVRVVKSVPVASMMSLKIQLLEQRERLVADDIALDVDLDAPGAILDMRERRLAHLAQLHQPPGQRDRLVLQLVEAVQRLRRRMCRARCASGYGSIPAARSASSFSIRYSRSSDICLYPSRLSCFFVFVGAASAHHM